MDAGGANQNPQPTHPYHGKDWEAASVALRVHGNTVSYRVSPDTYRTRKPSIQSLYQEVVVRGEVFVSVRLTPEG